MSIETINILLIEDNLGDVRLIQEMLQDITEWKINFVVANTLSRGLKYIAAEHIQVILLDLNLPDSTGLNTFRIVHRFAFEVPIIIMSIISDKEMVYQTLKEGAHDYLIKGHADAQMLVQAIRYALWSYYPA